MSFVIVTALVAAAPAGAGPEGQLTWAVHTTLVPPYSTHSTRASSPPYQDVRLKAQ